MSQPTNYESEFCGRVPLHQTNLVQPHGVLLVVAKEGLEIVQASENTELVFGLPARDLVTRSLTDFIDPAQAAKLKSRFNAGLTEKLPFVLSFAAGSYLAVIKDASNYLIVEIEREKRDLNTDGSFIRIYEELKYMMAAVEKADTTEETCEIAIRELKALSGFDKIMVYQFDKDWNGDVIAEIKEEGMESYIGLKFPASDIPRQARELYRKTPFRLIPDTEYDPIRLYPVLNPLTNAFTDLSDSNLRSVAAVHLEYLRNMKVRASMSTRILIDGQLWGLIACHHREAKHLSFEMCSIFELISNMVSSKIGAMQKQDSYSYKNEKQALYAKVIETFFKQEDLPAGFYQSREDLLHLLNAGGVSLVVDKHIHSFGKTPDDSSVENIVFWLQSSDVRGLYQQSHFSAVYEPAQKHTDVASGLLALPVQPERGDYVLAFRPEAIRQVNWGGNPSEAIQFEADRKNYHPRHSFKLWQQTVQQTALPWKQEELEIAEQFRNFVVEFTLNKIHNR